MSGIRNKSVATLLKITLLLVATTIEAGSPIAFDYSKLTSSLIKNMCQDGRGYIWVGTEYGLNRFDGHKFKQYLHTKDTTSLRANDIRYIYADHNNRLWIGTTSGLQLYDPVSDKFRYIPFEGIPQGTAISWILRLANGNLLICTTGRGTFQLSEQNMVLKKTNIIGDATSKISRIYQDRKQRLWIATSDGQLFVGNRKINTMAANGKTINNIAQNAQGKIIVATGAMPFVVDEKSFSLRPLSAKGISNLDIRSLKTVADGHVIMLCYNNGLLDVGPSLTIEHNDILSTLGGKEKAEYTSLIEDRDHNLWVAQNQGGLILLPYRQQQLSFANFISKERPFGIATVRSIATDSKGRIVIGSLDSHLYFCDNPNRISKDIILRSPAYSILPIGNKLLVGTRTNGLATVDPTSGGVSYFPATADVRVSGIARNRSGNIFIAVFGKNLYALDTSSGKMTPLDEKHGDKYAMKDHHLNTIFADSKGNVWAGHYKGVDIYDTHAHKFLSEPSLDELNNLACYAIAEDKGKNIWIATSDGLYKWSETTKKLDKYDTERGLTNNLVCGLAIDGKGNIWCSTFNGINMIDAKDGSIKNYYNISATADKEFTRSAFCSTQGGDLVLFGGVKGLTYFHPSRMKQTRLDHEVIVTGLTVGGKDVSGMYNGTLETTTDIYIGSDDDTFTLDFSTLDFTTADATTYEFCLDGNHWTQLQAGTHSVTFSNLSPGTYTLQLRATQSGIHSPIKTIKLHIAAPWYLSWYAMLVYAAIICVIAYLIYNNVKHRQAIKENEMRTQLFYNVAHDIRSPMTLIASPLEELLRRDFDSNTMRLLRTMYRNAHRILNMMNEMLDIRRMDVGKMQLSLEYTDMKAFVSGAMEAFEGIAERRQIDFQLKCNEDVRAWIDRNQLDKVVVNLIDNAFKYTPDGGNITIAIALDGKQKYSISVTDNGKGIDNGETQKLFDRFYQAEKGKINVGFGIGLHLCKMIVEKHHGTISANRATAEGGSIFTILLPIDGGEQHDETPEIIENEVAAHSHPFLASEPTDEERLRRKAVTPTKRSRILIVDDDDDIRDFLQAELSEAYRIEACANGVEALQKTVEHLPDIVVSDIIMPEMDGITLLKRLKGNTTTSHIPVILLTTKGELADKLKGLETGADAYLAKPFVVDELVALINNLVSGRNLLRGKFSGVQDQIDKAEKIELKGNDEQLMERIMKSVNKHIGDEDYGVEILASEVGLSRVQLHRRMKEMTGIATSDFIRNIRIKQAAELLAQNKVNVSQVAYAVGFQNRSYFSSVFKNYYGVTPQEYAENHVNTNCETISAPE